MESVGLGYFSPDFPKKFMENMSLVGPILRKFIKMDL
jgi:hypothetical protein